MDEPPGPLIVVWDITYACPLRCVHCYSASGRRPARLLGPDDRRRVLDAIVALRPETLIFGGGEPFLVDSLFELAERAERGGVRPETYTGGWTLTPQLAARAVDGFAGVTVSVDGATADVHDRIRGRRGSFDRALTALHLLHDAAEREPGTVDLTVDFTVTRTNFDQLERFCTEVVGTFPRLRGVYFGAAVPSGLAARSGFVEHGLVTAEQAARLADHELSRRLAGLVPDGVEVATTDNRDLQLHPDQVAQGRAPRHMQVEPDGAVRAMPIYEGTVGSLLDEPGGLLWARAVQRWSDPFVVATLGPARTLPRWGDATRAIDSRFASAAVRALLDRRAPYRP